MSSTEIQPRPKAKGLLAGFGEALQYGSKAKFQELVRTEVRRIAALPNGHTDTSGNRYRNEGPQPYSVDHIRTNVTKELPNGKQVPVATLFSYSDAERDQRTIGTYRLSTAGTKRREMEVFVQDTGNQDTVTASHYTIGITKKPKDLKLVENPSLLRRVFVARRILKNRP